MPNPESEEHTNPVICGLYPDFDEAQLKEAEENLDRYLEFALRLYERVRADPEAYSRFKALTASKPDPRIKPERSNPHNQNSNSL